ncbi:GNAT family N-acetyltransferase [Nocardia cyriacigeorgica]|uniref:GNAT family N-acetyltransferase n=1 Tax=Nocardia cyriacigeorgica TaxID=135487 RepID=UPI002458DA3C|nr:GNAT family N-acetyltransferase [Nocardia cyriacigeorgica]
MLVQSAGIVLRPASMGDIDEITRVVAEAFEHDDPIEEFVFPAEAVRRRNAPRMLRVMLKYRFIPAGGAEIAVRDGAIVGAILWYPAGYRKNLWREAVSGLQFLWAMGSATPRGMAVDDALARVAPPQPHNFVVYLGCEPAAQRMGVGKALMVSLRDRSDRQGVPLYGICKDDNIGFYEALGGRRVGATTVGRGGPEMTVMMREAASATV